MTTTAVLSNSEIIYILAPICLIIGIVAFYLTFFANKAKH
jgi:nitrogen fixation-related uncharacterized protein